MIPLLLLAVALACLAGTALLLRSLGSRYRVGRLLAATREVSIDEARARAATADQSPSYVRVTGRISSDEEFPDENDRPLVYRRKRLEVAPRAGQWQVISDEREAVPFGVEARSSFIAVDEAAVGDGLVAIPREAGGLVRDLPRDLVDNIDAGLGAIGEDTSARLVVEQLSAVEHAIVCGMPVMRGGEPALSTGLGRPLIVTTLAADDAVRLLAAPHRRRVLAAAALLAAAVILALASGVAILAGL